VTLVLLPVLRTFAVSSGSVKKRVAPAHPITSCYLLPRQKFKVKEVEVDQPISIQAMPRGVTSCYLLS
jgi:hypothetical protein